MTKKPNLGMTEDLAYLLGAIKGNGSVSSNKKYLYKDGKYWHKLYNISFHNQDFEFSRKIYHIMKDINLNPAFCNEKACLLVSACSKTMREWYAQLNIHDIEKILKQNRKYILAFICGFYEAQGCYYYETGVKHPYTTITDGNEELITLIHKLISELGFNAKLYKIKRGKTAFKEGFAFFIHIRRKGEAERFIKMINPCFKNEPSNKWF
jgi:intein/homing endonuclease